MRVKAQLKAAGAMLLCSLGVTQGAWAATDIVDPTTETPTFLLWDHVLPIFGHRPGRQRPFHTHWAIYLYSLGIWRFGHSKLP